MHARLRVFAAVAIAVALAGCGTTPRLAVKVERIPCPPAALEVSCPETPAPAAGDTWTDYQDRVKAWGATCRAAVAAWNEAHRACAKRP